MFYDLQIKYPCLTIMRYIYIDNNIAVLIIFKAIPSYTETTYTPCQDAIMICLNKIIEYST